MNIDVVEVSTARVWWVGHVQVGQAVLPDHQDYHDHDIMLDDDDDDEYGNYDDDDDFGFGGSAMSRLACSPP